MVDVACEAPDLELVFVEWVNAVICETSACKMLFSRFSVAIESAPGQPRRRLLVGPDMTKALRQCRIKTPGPYDRLLCYARLNIAGAQFERLSEVRREHLGRQGHVPAGARTQRPAPANISAAMARAASLTASERGWRIASQFIAKPVQSEGSAEGGTPNNAANHGSRGSRARAPVRPLPVGQGHERSGRSRPTSQ